MTPHVDLETTGLIIGLVTAWVGAHEVASFSEVSAIVGEQSTEGDEGFLTACIGQKDKHVGHQRYHKGTFYMYIFFHHILLNRNCYNHVPSY